MSRTIKITESVEELEAKLAELKTKEDNFASEFDKITDIGDAVDSDYLDELTSKYHDVIDEAYLIQEKINILKRHERQKDIDKNELYLVSNNID